MYDAVNRNSDTAVAAVYTLPKGRKLQCNQVSAMMPEIEILTCKHFTKNLEDHLKDHFVKLSVLLQQGTKRKKHKHDHHLVLCRRKWNATAWKLALMYYNLSCMENNFENN